MTQFTESITAALADFPQRKIDEFNKRLIDLGLRPEAINDKGLACISLVLGFWGVQILHSGSPSDLRAVLTHAYAMPDAPQLENPMWSFFKLALHRLRDLCRYPEPDETTVIDLAMEIVTVASDAQGILGVS